VTAATRPRKHRGTRPRISIADLLIGETVLHNGVGRHRIYSDYELLADALLMTQQWVR
jgi:predicted nucleic acid-binding protein